MKNITALALILVLAGCGFSAESQQVLGVYLPRDVKVNTPGPMLGQITILSGAEHMVALAQSIAMGRLALADQRLVIDRPTILSRLASNGISASDVKFTGAEKVAVSLDNTIIDSERLLQAAMSYIKATAEQNHFSSWRVVRYPEDLVLGELKSNISLKAVQSQTIGTNVIRVIVDVFAGDEKVGRQFVDFRVKYSVRQAVAIAEIFKDSFITAANIKVQIVEADRPGGVDLAGLYGMMAGRDIKRDTVITEDMLTSPKQQVLVKRNQSVLIKIDYSALTVTAIGKAMNDGKAGEFIKVQNNDSKRIILAKVNQDGTVEPVF
ncbi:MAG: flagellar basal body P-ring formation chaperone FlgA [Phycisphaerae bacterium]|nr:flagellar basal body P-ring formation chaperone FlgA [Phycisphaerae bacterium]